MQLMRYRGPNSEVCPDGLHERNLTGFPDLEESPEQRNFLDFYSFLVWLVASEEAE